MPTTTDDTTAGSGPLANSVSVDDRDDATRPRKNVLIDTMELVERRKEVQVPDHLLETKTFTKTGHNSMVHVRPGVIYFDGFEVNEKHVKKMIVLNASSGLLRIHVIPPQSKYFSIKYKKGERMVPGMALECTVVFKPDEWRYYYDCIGINCPGNDNLIIPIHGYPIMSTKEFPRNFNFPVTALGETSSQVFPLRCMVPVVFEFELIYIQHHPAFLIHPMAGSIPANSEVEVTVTFAPFEFQTAFMQVQLNFSQFNAKPIVCTFTGTCKPGLLKEKTLTQLDLIEEGGDARPMTPLERARQNRALKAKIKKVPHQPPSQSVEYNGVEFSSVSGSLYFVNQVLIHEPGKLKAKDLRDTALGQKETSETYVRQVKGARFEIAIRQNVYEERQNQLRWEVKIGDELIPDEQRRLILEARKQAYKYYKERVNVVPADEYGRQKTKLSSVRTIRDTSKHAEGGVLFDPYLNDMWAGRNAALNTFIQAARKVIVRRRAETKLKLLKGFILKCDQKQLSEEEEDKEEATTARKKKDHKEDMAHLNITASRIQRSRFAIYVHPKFKDDLAADALGTVKMGKIRIIVKEHVPYFNLKVPQTYRLNDYQPHSVYTASSGYVPPRLAQPLRTGAPEEVIVLPRARHASMQAIVSEDLDVTEGNLTEVVVEERGIPSGAPMAVVSPLRLPEGLFFPIDYSPLHIMNAAPGLQVFQAPMPYSEVDAEFHLCPLPRYFRSDRDKRKVTSTQKKYLDRDDVIQGLMSWKSFPSQGLNTLFNIPTLTSVWVPRGDEKFSTDMMPLDVPRLFRGLPTDDAECLAEESQWDDESTLVHLTPNMVKAQFMSALNVASVEDLSKSRSEMFPFGNKMPTTNIPVGPKGPVPREKREEQLDYFITKRFNRLGSRFECKLSSLNSMLNKSHLRLQRLAPSLNNVSFRR